MWYEIMKEFNCKATSIWSSCDDERKWLLHTDNLERMEKEGRRSWKISSGLTGHRINCTSTAPSSCGVHEIIIPFTVRYKKMTLNVILLKIGKGRNGQDEAIA